jgi:hypothetical protein
MPTESDEIFFIEAEQLRPLPARPMRAGLFGRSLEEALQMLLQRYPQVIPGKQIDPASEDPPRFVLLRREMPVGGWSLDHLYIDQRGVLTLVETKLIQNPESRREVIGQVIEYAANANESWAYGRARQYATEFWSKQGRGLDEVLLGEFGEDLDIEGFWSAVEENLKDGRIRLIIAADELRAEVRRMIEYLNREMQNAEVLGLELKCYGKESTPLVLVPRLVGQTQAGADRRGTGPDVVLWTVDKLRRAFESLENEEGRRLQTVLDWAVSNRFLIEGRTQFPAFGLRGKGEERILTVFSSGLIFLFFEGRRYPGGAEERDMLVNDLKALGMLDPDIVPGEVVSGRASTRKLSELDDNEFARLLDVLSRYCG